VARAWVYAEITTDGPHPAALELLTHARSFDETPAAIALGPGATEAAVELGAHGAATVYTSDDPVFSEHPGRPAAHALAGLIEAEAPDVVLFAQTYDSRDVAGRLQGRIGSALMGNATSIADPRHARAEIFGGTKIVDVELAGPAPTLILLRPKSITAEPTGGTAQVVPLEAAVPEDVRGARIVERHEEAASGPRLEDAKVVLAGGRGLGGPDAFAMLDELASAIGGAAVGASRAAVDAGWVPYSYQIGQTGKTVKPEVYLAAGISGALQHIVGMKGAKRIVAINKDEDAPLLAMADLGVVGDLFQVLPALTEEIRRRKGS
jgi:electron transfer flavoprotein alpha subunit